MDSLQEILSRLEKSGTTFKPLTDKEREQFKVDSLNESIGTRNEEDGYNCDICKNKGFIAKLIQLPDGTYNHTCAPCKCEETRRSILRLKKSGLKDIIHDYTFSKFEVSEPWQKSIKEAAIAYAKDPRGWFFLGGQSGCGKTHLCTAICREFLLKGRQVVYMLWRDDIVKIKGAVTDSEKYNGLINKFKKAEVLYIDDLFKTGKKAEVLYIDDLFKTRKAVDNTIQKPTAADINVAFEILNYRYNNPALLTVISSELSVDELLDIDEAIGGRIFERAKSFNIAQDRGRNYRIKKAVIV